MSDSVMVEAVTKKAVSSVKWSALMEVVSRTAQPIITVILARLLSPADFGVVATATIAISFAQMFWDAGLSKALIQTNEAAEKAANVVFWSNAVLGLVIYIFLFVTAPWVAVFFNSPESGPVLRVLGVQILIASLSSVQQALFVRELDFRRLFWVKLVTAFFPGFFSIPLALSGFGVWALVAGSLAGQTLSLILLWRLSPWRPRLAYELRYARRLFGFGFWVVAESIGAWLITWGDSLILGKFLGVHDLGVYRTGWMLVTVIFGLTLNPFLPVLYPSFSRLQGDSSALKEYFHKVNRIVTALALPMGIGLFFLGPEIASVLFGERWQGLGAVLSVLGLMFGFAWLVGINPELYRAMGRPDVNTKLMYLQLLYYLPAYMAAAQFGLETFLYVRFAVALVGLPIHIYLCHRMLGVSPLYLWYGGRPMILASLMMTAVLAGTKWTLCGCEWDMPQALELALLVSVGMSTYTGALFLLDKRFAVSTKILLQKAVLN